MKRYVVRCGRLNCHHAYLGELNRYEADELRETSQRHANLSARVLGPESAAPPVLGPEEELFLISTAPEPRNRRLSSATGYDPERDVFVMACADPSHGRTVELGRANLLAVLDRVDALDPEELQFLERADLTGDVPQMLRTNATQTRWYSLTLIDRFIRSTR